MIKALLWIGCALIGVMNYCCCCVASKADERMERLYPHQRQEEDE